MVLMCVLAVLLLVGLVLTVRWSGTPYVTPEAATPGDPVPSGRDVVGSYARGAAIAVVGGLWAGLLVTGPAVRLIMRLLAVTAGDDAQGRITEAEEVVGQISLGGTIGLIIFGGLLSGFLSGPLYVVIRRWLPRGVWAGVAFGGLHLVIAATRIEPLRPDNPDFELVGPDWLAVLAFGLTVMLHGMAVVAFANRYSHAFTPTADGGVDRRQIAGPLLGPAAFTLASIVGVAAVVAGLIVTLVASRLAPVVAAVRGRGFVVAGRLALAVLALGFTPSAVSDLLDIV